MQKKTYIFCRGEECPVRNTCLRYTKRNETTNCIGGYTLMRKCTHQKRFLQDENNVNKDGNEHRK